MNVKTDPVLARRLKLSTGSIVVAVVLTCVALLAVAATVGPSVTVGEDSAVAIEAPMDGVDSRLAVPQSNRQAFSGADNSDFVRR